MTANERDSRVAVVHGCFPEGIINDKEMVVKVKTRQERV